MIDSDTELLDTAVRLAVAALLGMMVGLEREFRDKPAGVRTHMLVSSGSAAFIIITLALVRGPLQDAAGVVTDPTRIVEGIIGGIGFLGAGAIIRGGSGVTGLTTGASIWVAGAIGLASGIGFFDIALMLSVLVVIIVFALGWIERRFTRMLEADRDDGREGARDADQ